MRLYVIIAFLIFCILAVNATQQNNANKKNQLAKKKLTNGSAVVNSNHLTKLKPRARNLSKKASKGKVLKVKPSLARKNKKVLRRVVKKSNHKSNAPKKIARKTSNRNSIKRGSRANSRKRLAKQELSDSTENKSIGAGQASGDIEATGSGNKPQDTSNQPANSANPAASSPSQPAANDPNSSDLASPSQGANPLSSSPFNIPKSNGQNQAIGAAFSQSSNGGSAFAAGFASIGKQNTAGGYGQVNSNKQASDPNSENLNPNISGEPAPVETGAEDGSGELAAYRKRPNRG